MFRHRPEIPDESLIPAKSRLLRSLRWDTGLLCRFFEVYCTEFLRLWGQCAYQRGTLPETSLCAVGANKVFTTLHNGGYRLANLLRRVILFEVHMSAEVSGLNLLGQNYITHF